MAYRIGRVAKLVGTATLPLASLLLFGCSPGGGTSSVAKTKVEALDKQTGQPLDLKALDATALKINATEYGIYRTLMRESGIDADLGGEAAGAAALSALSAQFRQTILGEAARMPRYIKAAGGNIPDGFVGGGVAFVTGMAGARTIGDLAGSDEANGDVPYQNQKADADSSIDMKIGQSDASVETITEGKVEGMTGRITVKMKFDLCPQPDGKVHIDFEAQSVLKSATSGATINTKVTSELTRWVTDDAEFDGDRLEHTGRVEYATVGGAGGANGAYVDYSNEMSLSTGRMGGKVNRSSSKASAAEADIAKGIAAVNTLVVFEASNAAAKALKSGRCVTLKPTSTPSKRNRLKPSTAFEVLAAPRSKIDGSPTGGTVKATLSGGSSLIPADTKVKADAKYAYVAPGEKNKKASIAFEARSKRGIGKATLDFDTNNTAYTAAGGLDAFYGTGTICSFSEKFTISGRGVTNTYTPTSETGGTYSYSGNLGGFAVYGQGTYSVQADENGGTMRATGPGTVVTPLGPRTRPGTEIYKLTPAEPCG